MSYDGPGTHYSCGCWRGGDPSMHPRICPTHGGQWRMRRIKQGSMSRVEETPIYKEVRNGESV